MTDKNPSLAPDFTLKDGDGNDWRLSDRRGRVVVLLFYPGDETPVCTKQMCSVRDNWEEYEETGAEVVGVSTDSVESHKKFAERHSLPLRLLSDPDRRVAESYGAKSWLPGRAARAVVVIDAEGRVRHNKAQPLSLFRPKDDEVLEAIRAAKGVMSDE
ncbi:MAG TPA: peroxiredoxin [Pyrinomonadaceae bacterium]|nr:peroxiredoxin [Pyrinomonadaceae bacterium]